MLIGYARVSTQDQNLELQREALSKAGCKKVFEDKVSGTRADRPGLAKTLEMLREGDTLVVLEARPAGPVGQATGRSGRRSAQARCPVQEPHRLHRHRHTIRAVLLPRHGEPCRNGARADRRAHPRRAGSRQAARPQRRPQAEDDRQQDRVGQEAAVPAGAAQGRGQEPRRVHSDAVPLGASLTHA